jgi:hypothetical protein
VSKYHGDYTSASEKEKDEVKNPSYYKDVIPGYEYMQIMEHVLGKDGFIGHCRGQIFKYLFRLGKKDQILQDADKVKWYADYLADYLLRLNTGKAPFIKKD